MAWAAAAAGESVTLAEDPTPDDVAAVLKDGTLLCRFHLSFCLPALEDLNLARLAEKLGAGPVDYTRNPRMPFHKVRGGGRWPGRKGGGPQMENISQFLGAIKAFGVPEISSFQTVDLYEAKAVYKVVECLRSLAAVVPYPPSSRFNFLIMVPLALKGQAEGGPR